MHWPEPSAAAVWAKAPACVNALHVLVRKADFDCAAAEKDSKLFAGGIARRRAEICDHAMLRLTNFGPFQIAEKSVSDKINSLERLSDRDPEQVQMLQRLKRALTDLREGIPATQRLLQERCKVRQGASL